jgi:hypothetical protein
MDEAANYIAQQLEKADPAGAWRLRDAFDDETFTLIPVVAKALLSSLSQTILGLSPEPNEYFTTEEISAEHREQLPSSGMRWVEIIAFSAGTTVDVKLQCLACKVFVRDEFSNIVISGMAE